MDAPVARRMWRLFEPVHDVVYFSPEPIAAAADLGLRGFWMGYTAFRAAPLGPVGPAPVTAAFHGFHPDRIARALPDAWTIAAPDAVLAARARGTGDALRRIWSAAGLDPAAVEPAADLAWEVAQRCDDAGRVLGAANRALPRPGDSVHALWQATTTLREHRGDGHVAVLVARGVAPLHAHLLKVAAGETAPDMLRESRRIPADDWSAGLEQLRARGLVDVDGRLTDAGAVERAEVERLTDEAATGPWAASGDATTEELAGLLQPYAAAVVASGDLPARNPVGLA